MTENPAEKVKKRLQNLEQAKRHVEANNERRKKDAEHARYQKEIDLKSEANEISRQSKNISFFSLIIAFFALIVSIVALAKAWGWF